MNEGRDEPRHEKAVEREGDHGRRVHEAVKEPDKHPQGKWDKNDKKDHHD